MLVCNVSLRPPRSAIAADIAEAAAALDDIGGGQVTFVTLVDDPASVSDFADAYSGEIMLEAASANVTLDASIPAISAVTVVETATASDTVSSPAFPLSLTGLIGWWDANVGLTLSGSSITAVADQSGAGNNLGNSTGANRATYSATGLNSLPAMVFSTPPATFLNKTSFPMGTGNTLTIFAVATLTSSSMSNARLMNYVAPGFQDFNSVQCWLMSRPTTTSNINFYRNATAVTSSMGLATPRRLIVTVNSSGVQTLYIDGVAGTASATQAGNWGTGGILTLGTDGSNAWAGAVSELGIATGWHDATTVAQLDTYLKTKWGL